MVVRGDGLVMAAGVFSEESDGGGMERLPIRNRKLRHEVFRSRDRRSCSCSFFEPVKVRSLHVTRHFRAN
jgi:hypothetical protein